MADWHEIVRQRLSGLALEPQDRREVIEELSGHLEETFEQLRREGRTENESVQLTLAQVDDWRVLRRRIQTARAKEHIMSNRVKQFWIPSIATFVFSESLLALSQKFGPRPTIFAFSGNPAVLVFYIPWLLALPFIGAMGAYLAHRAGGPPRAVFSAVLFPALAILGVFLSVLPVALIVDRHVDHNIMAAGFLVGLLGWVLLPAAALLAGGLPAYLFLSRHLTSGRVASQ
ncbi:MAG TPA: hypothetical protein VEI73_13960 [Candidatus Acidoferrum sp.]|nr:hypothetical protein [Candidatus Acidoferrum sp.]